jgi:hypothetical protein
MWRAVLASLLFAVISVGRAHAAPDVETSGEAPAGADQRNDQLLRAALEAYARGELETADALLQTVHQNDPSARTLRGLGIVAFQRGRYRSALALLEQSLVHPKLPLGGSLRASVSELIAECHARLGRIKLEVTPVDAQLWVDGEPCAFESGASLTLEVGDHQLVLRREGFQERTLSVAVAATSELPLQVRLDAIPLPSATEESAIQLTRPPATGAIAAHASDAPPREHPRAAKRQRLLRTGTVTLGLAIAALGVGVTSMVLANQRVEAVERECKALTSKRCTPGEAARKEEDANLPLLSRLTTGGFIGGGALFATGAGVLLALPAHPGAPRAWGISFSGRF